MSAILSPEDLLSILRSHMGKPLDGSVIYTGTIPLRGGIFLAKPYFEAELFDRPTGRSLRCQYRVRRIDAF
ncbi:MAG: DUF2848 domain-containing protein [Deltaproteobacteria bacterium]|nr:MAG: DUF2848 domain-containing protein [Deltaproteobacteria bacterium]